VPQVIGGARKARPVDNCDQRFQLGKRIRALCTRF